MTPQKRVIVSYRKTKPEYRDFAEAVAHKLGAEGFLPWFDEWDILVGDSLPREIGDAFKNVYAVVPIVTPDYPHGKWAREELETAITKRIEQNIKVIPVVYEAGEMPELLRALVRVDCTDHREEVFEAQFKRIIDALNELDVNPYRR
jgi:hypothetical protein